MNKLKASLAETLTWSHAKRACVLAVLNTLSYLVLTIDMRSVAQANMSVALESNMIIAVLSFTLLKHIQNCGGWLACLGYTIGGTLGTYLGIILTLNHALLGK